MKKIWVVVIVILALLILVPVVSYLRLMMWGRGYVEDTQDFARESSEGQLKCSGDTDISFEIKKACRESGNIKITLLSTGLTKLESFAVVMDDSSQRVNESLTSFNQKQIVVSGTSDEVRVIPFIEGDLGCSNRAESAVVVDC